MSSGTWVLGRLRGCLPRSPRLGVGWGTRTLNPKGLGGLDGGGGAVRRVPTPRLPRELQNSGSPYAGPLTPAS